MGHDELFEEFCKWNPDFAKTIIDYGPWGDSKTSIVVWSNNGLAYKAKRHECGKFTIQIVSDEDIRKKFGME